MRDTWQVLAAIRELHAEILRLQELVEKRPDVAAMEAASTQAEKDAALLWKFSTTPEA